MAKVDLGTKRQCPNCGAKYYDLNKSPAVCPKCGTLFEVTTAKVRAPEAAVEEEEVENEDEADTGPEVISLEEADAEATGDGASDDDNEDDDLSVDDDDDDDAFLEEDEDEDDDVTDIVGGVDDDDS